MVSDITTLTPDIKRFRLISADGQPLPPFSGGAHIIVEISDGGILRSNSYSLMSSPARPSHYEIGVRREDQGRGGSKLLHESVEPGDVLRIGHPVNLFPIAQVARKHLLIAGGIGITPIMAMADQLWRDHRPFEVHYAMRWRGAAACVDELAARYEDRLFSYCSDLGQRLNFETLLRFQPLGAHLYVCGPAGMIAAALGAAERLGWPPQNLHHERFAAPAIGRPYQVTLARSGLVVDVTERQSMLEAIEAAGVKAPYMCRGGACGQCETRVLSREGELLHADHYLTEEEKRSGDKVMPCVSRFVGASLALDL